VIITSDRQLREKNKKVNYRKQIAHQHPRPTLWRFPHI